MDAQNKKELAAKMAQQRAGGGRKPLPGAAAAKQQSQTMSFFGDEGDGWMMSPKTILLFSVAYMGCVILLHIFSKVTSIKKSADPAAAPEPETAAGDL